MRKGKTVTTTKKVQRRVYRTVTVEKQITVCEPCYVLFGAAVAEARIGAGMTQGELAERLGYAGHTSIVNIECGRQRVALADVFLFAKALRVKPEKLFLAASK